MRRFTQIATAIAALLALAALTPAQSPGRVFTMSNDASANELLAFDRAHDGSLTSAGAYPTGGVGTGAGLGNQGGLATACGRRFILTVNAGSDDVSVFRTSGRGGLRLTDRVSSGGTRPISIAVRHRLVYVLNSGGTAASPDNVTGFWLLPNGKLLPIPNSTRSLSADATGPAQVGFSPRGDVLVVTEKATNNIVTFPMAGLVPGAAIVTPSEGQTPFGFSFARPNRLVVSEATGGGPSTVSSYRVNRDGTIAPLTSALPIMQSAACWVAITRNGRFAYTTNTASDSVTGLHLTRNGGLALLDANGQSGMTGSGSAPIDMAFSAGDRFLYVLNGGNATIAAFRVRQGNGSLRELSTSAAVVPAGTNGLLAW